jgi:hypothetical protein
MHLPIFGPTLATRNMLVSYKMVTAKAREKLASKGVKSQYF